MGEKCDNATRMCRKVSENPFYASHNHTLVALGFHVKHFGPAFVSQPCIAFLAQYKFLQLDPHVVPCVAGGVLDIDKFL